MFLNQSTYLTASTVYIYKIQLTESNFQVQFSNWVKVHSKIGGADEIEMYVSLGWC